MYEEICVSLYDSDENRWQNIEKKTESEIAREKQRYNEREGRIS